MPSIDFSFAEVAAALGRTDAAGRHAQLLGAFAAAAQSGDLEGLMRLSPPTSRRRGSPERPVRTAAFELADGVARALYVVRNPDKLRHLGVAPRPR